MFSISTEIQLARNRYNPEKILKKTRGLASDFRVNKLPNESIVIEMQPIPCCNQTARKVISDFNHPGEYRTVRGAKENIILAIVAFENHIYEDPTEIKDEIIQSYRNVKTLIGMYNQVEREEAEYYLDNIEEP